MTTPTTDQEIPGQLSVDPDAPYGRKEDGTPKGKPGRKPSGSTGPRSPRMTATPPPRLRPAQPTRKGGPVDYTEGLGGLLQMVALPLAIAGTTNDAFAADAAALSLHGPGIITALNDVAQDQPAVANVLDRILSAGPYGALIMAVLPLGLQLAANHGAVPEQVATALGAKPPVQLAVHMRHQAAEAARKVAEAQARAEAQAA